MARVSRELIDRQRGRCARLQRLSRRRALSDAESLELERLLRMRADRQRYVPRPAPSIEDQIAAADKRRRLLYQRRLVASARIDVLTAQIARLRQQQRAAR